MVKKDDSIVETEGTVEENNNDYETQEGTLPVSGPSGSTYFLLTETEVKRFEDISRRYLSDNAFTNVSDLQELDRIIIMETMCLRWSNWLSTDKDYWGDPIVADEIRKSIKEYSTELRLLKKQLGIDKSTREKDKGTSLAEYVENLGRRAKEFGYHREEQLAKALTLFNEMMALVTLHKNCDEIERKEMHCTATDVIQWLDEVCIPEYQKIDDYFKQKKQRMWIKEI